MKMKMRGKVENTRGKQNEKKFVDMIEQFLNV